MPGNQHRKRTKSLLFLAAFADFDFLLPGILYFDERAIGTKDDAKGDVLEAKSGLWQAVGWIFGKPVEERVE